MKIPTHHKTKILQAYLDKAITKDELKILLTDGHAYGLILFLRADTNVLWQFNFDYRYLYSGTKASRVSMVKLL